MLLFGATPSAFAKHEFGTIKDGREFSYMDKFCFGNGEQCDGCLVTGRVWPTRVRSNERLLLFDDQQKSWESIYNHPTMTCEEKVKHAKWSQPIKKEYLRDEGFFEFSVNVREGLRPRFWYLVLTACGSPPVEAKWEVKWFNHGGWTKREFSHDDQGLLQLYIVCTVLSTVVSIVYCVDRNYTSGHVRRLHPMTWWIAASTVFFTCNMAAHAAHLYMYAGDGVGLPVAKMIGRGLGVVYQVGLPVVLVAIAKGWNINSDGLKQDLRFGVLAVTTIAAYSAVFAWHARIQDPASNQYMYDTLPGMGILALRIATLIWFLFEVWQTLQYYHSTATGRITYLWLGLIGGLWLISFPIYIAIAPIFGHQWRDQAVVILVVATDMVALLSVAAWFRASWVAEHFDTSGQVQYSASSSGIKDIGENSELDSILGGEQ